MTFARTVVNRYYHHLQLPKMVLYHPESNISHYMEFQTLQKNIKYLDKISKIPTFFKQFLHFFNFLFQWLIFPSQFFNFFGSFLQYTVLCWLEKDDKMLLHFFRKFKNSGQMPILWKSCCKCIVNFCLM